MYVLNILTYCIAKKIPERKFHDFALKQAFHVINFAISMLIFSLVMITQLHFHELGQIAKNMKF